MSDLTVELLTQIRDLLIPVSEAARPAYEEALRKRYQRNIQLIIDIVGRSQKQIDAAKLMDGSRSLAQIRTETKFDASNFSKFMKRLTAAGVADELEGHIRISPSPDVIPWPQSSEAK